MIDNETKRLAITVQRIPPTRYGTRKSNAELNSATTKEPNTGAWGAP